MAVNAPNERLRYAAARAVLSYSLASAWFILRETAAAAVDSGMRGGLVTRALASPWSAAAFCACVLWMLLRPSALPAAAVALAFFAGNEAARWIDPKHVEHCIVMPGAVVLLYAASRAARRGAPSARAESESWELCLCLMGAMYFMAGLTKLRDAGPAWINGDYIRLLAAAAAAKSDGLLRATRQALADSPSLALTASMGTVAVELGAAAFVVPAWRPWAAGAMFCVHAGIAVIMGINWEGFPLLLPILALPLPARLSARLK